jgi:hypothetical protein
MGAETQTPPGALPTIRPGMRINFTLEYLVALIGGVVFCTTVYLKVDRLEQDMSLVKKALGVTEIRPPAPTSANPHPTGANP